MTDYRDSHSAEGYGECYSQTYTDGYYFHQWNLLERPLLGAFLAQLKADGASSCLDFACGTGRITSVAESIFPSVVGVDVSSSMLEQARKSVNSAELIQQDITKQSLDQNFDVCTAFRFFLNAGDSLRREALSAIYEHLSENGSLVANVHVTSSSPLGLAYRLRNWVKGNTLANIESYENFEALLEGSGFYVDDVRWYSYLPRIGWMFPRAAEYAMLPVEKFASRFPLIPSRAAQAFIVVARKK